MAIVLSLATQPARMSKYLVAIRALGATPRSRLTFGELKTLARSGLSRFFALLHARIASQQSFDFERTAQVGVNLKKSPRDCELRSTSLTHNTAAGCVNR